MTSDPTPRGPVRFSVVTTVFDPDPAHLVECFRSVDEQTGGLSDARADTTWEHIVVDDGSRNAEVNEILDGADRSASTESGSGRRIVIRRAANGGIVEASNDALDAAVGEFVVLLDHDDVLAPNALTAVAHAIDRTSRSRDDRRAIGVVYSDHDLLRPDGRLASPVYKPDFSLTRLRNHNYITHLVVARRSAVQAVGGFRAGFDGAQDHDLLLRLAEAGEGFVHVPEVLLHWRQSAASVATDTANKPQAFANLRRAVEQHLERSGIESDVVDGPHPGVVRIRRRLTGRPSVSVVMPTRGSTGTVWGVERVFAHQAIASLRDAAPGCDLEVVAVIDTDTAPIVERGLRMICDRDIGAGFTPVPYDEPFNFSDKINRGVAASTGDFVLLLNDDTQLIERNSIDEMVALAQEPPIGMVGAKLLFEDGRLQHGGHVYNGTISHALLGWPGDHPGPHRLLCVERECAGVTAAAAVLRRSVFEDVGGMETDLAVNYNDVDLSLRIRRAGYSNVWTPHASWYHFERQSGEHPIDPHEIEVIQRLWGDALTTDPYYNPNLAPGRTDWLELPLRSGAPPYELTPDGEKIWS